MSQRDHGLVKSGRTMFGIGTIGIVGCVAFMMCTKYIFGPAFKKKRLADSQQFAETLIQLESGVEQKKRADMNKYG